MRNNKFKDVEHIRREYIWSGWALATEFYLTVLKGPPPDSSSLEKTEKTSADNENGFQVYYQEPG